MIHRKFQRLGPQRSGVSGSALSSMRGVPQAAALLWLAGAVQFAMAQQTSGNQASGPAGEQVTEIVVTAQRRSESLQDVPIAVTAVTSARLEAIGIQTMENLSELSPGLTTPDMNGYFQPHIRGVGTSSNGAGIENPIALYVDGVYIANPPSA